MTAPQTTPGPTVFESAFHELVYLVSRERSLIASALRVYKARLLSAKKADEAVEMDTEQHDSTIASIDFFLERFKDQRDIGMAGTPIGDALTRKHFVSKDGHSLEAESVVELLDSIGIKADASVVSAWHLAMREEVYQFVKLRAAINADPNSDRPMPPRPAHLPVAWFPEVEREIMQNVPTLQPLAPEPAAEDGGGHLEPAAELPPVTSEKEAKAFETLDAELTNLAGRGHMKGKEFGPLAKRIVKSLVALPMGPDFDTATDIVKSIGKNDDNGERLAAYVRSCVGIAQLEVAKREAARNPAPEAVSPEPTITAPGEPTPHEDESKPTSNPEPVDPPAPAEPMPDTPKSPEPADTIVRSQAESETLDEVVSRTAANLDAAMSPEDVDEWIGRGPWGVEAHKDASGVPGDEWAIVLKDAEGKEVERFPRVFPDIDVARTRAARMNRVRASTLGRPGGPTEG